MLIYPYYFYRGAMWRCGVLHDHLWTMECNLSHTLGSISWSLWFIYTYSRSESIFPAGAWRLAEKRNHTTDAVYLGQDDKTILHHIHRIIWFIFCWGTALVSCARKAEFLLSFCSHLLNFWPFSQSWFSLDYFFSFEENSLINSV